jgi:hypothetical protein
MVAVMMMMMKMLLPPKILIDAGSMPSTSSPSGSLSEARFHKFLVSLCVGSLFCMHRVGVFDKAKLPTPDNLPPRCVNKCSVHFCNFRFVFYSLEITSLISIFIALYEFGILMKQA